MWAATDSSTSRSQGFRFPRQETFSFMYVGAFIPVVLGGSLAQPTASPSVPREL